MSIIRDLIEIEKVFTKNKKTPCDIAAALEEELYSESKGEDIKLGDMHLTHYIRRQLKDEKLLFKQAIYIQKLNKKIKQFQHFINQL